MKRPPKTPDQGPAIEDKPLPPGWERRVYAAYLLSMGVTLGDTAEHENVGCDVRTLYDWRKHWSWPLALETARKRWLDSCEKAAHYTILKAIQKGDATTARWFLERVDPKFKQRSSVTVREGGRRGLSKAKAAQLRRAALGVGGDE